MSRSLKQASEKFKKRVLARWRSMSTRGVAFEQAAVELGVRVDDLRAWSQEQVTSALIVPVQITPGAGGARGLVAVLAGGVRVEGLTIADVVELARRLS